MNGWRHLEPVCTDPRGACRVATDPGTGVCDAGEPPPAEPVDEAEAARLLFHLRFDTGWGCERCGHPRCTQLRSRPRVFGCNRCEHPFSVTAGTALHRCRVPLVKVVAAARWLTRPGVSVSARALARVLGVGIETAWTLGHRLRTGFLERPAVRLGGEVALCASHVRARPPRGQRRSTPFPERARFVLLADRSGRVAAEIGQPDPCGLRRFLDRHADVDDPERGSVPLAYDPARIGNQTHHGVSERWLPLYVGAVTGWQNAVLEGREPAEVTLTAALRSDRSPFARLRPRPPHLRRRTARELELSWDRVGRWSRPPRCGLVGTSAPLCIHGDPAAS